MKLGYFFEVGSGVWLDMLVNVRRFLLLLPVALIPLMFDGCTRTAVPSVMETRAIAAQQMQEANLARQEMELIPPPSKTRYMAVKSLTVWENPYLTVQGDMVTLHVLLADANTSDLGQGTLLRPVGARRQDLNVRVGDLPAALNAIPEGSWPYGRVVAVEEAHDVPLKARPQVRRNMEAAMGVLNDLGVVVYEWGEGAPGIR